MKVDDARRQAYLDAYEDWQRKLAELHAVLLEGARDLSGDQWKGLLNRESRAKARYDEARLALLGFGAPADSPFGD